MQEFRESVLLAGGYPGVVAALGLPEHVVDFFDRGHELLGNFDRGVNLGF